MMQENRVQRMEIWGVVGVVTLYVIRRLVTEIQQLTFLKEAAERHGVSAATISQNLAHYDHALNNNVPLIAGATLFIVAWYVFRTLTYPHVQAGTNPKKAWTYGGLTVLLLLAAAFVYHYLKLHIRPVDSGTGTISGLKVYSLYRRQTVLADAIGLGILLGTYECLAQLCQYMIRTLTPESGGVHRVVGYLLLGGGVLLASMYAAYGYVPPTLWRGETRDFFLSLGLGVLIITLQQYAYIHILPLLKESHRSDLEVAGKTLPFLLIGLAGAALLWGPYYGFHYHATDLLSVAVIAWLAGFFIAYLRQLLTREKTELQTQVSASAAEMAGLRAQINPHFLFNALNSLYATALKEKGEQTADGIQKLGDMMRFMLHENNRDRIPLKREIEYLRNYIQIQRMRIDETHNIEIRVNIQEPDRPVYLAPMLLTPFVENAFKHGISLRHPSWIFITVTLDDTRLYVKVHNSRHAKPADSPDRHDPEAAESGVGLVNVRKRLELIYPGRHELTIQQSEQDYFASLTLVYG